MSERLHLIVDIQDCLGERSLFGPRTRGVVVAQCALLKYDLTDKSCGQQGEALFDRQCGEPDEVIASLADPDVWRDVDAGFVERVRLHNQ